MSIRTNKRNSFLITSATVLILWAALLTNTSTAQANNSVFSGGSHFTSEITGVRFQFPKDVKGQLDPQGGTIGFANTSNTLGGYIFGGSAGGGQTASSLAIRKLLPLLGAEVQQVLVDTSANNTATSQFTVANAAGATFFMHLEIRQGTAGNYVAFLGNSEINSRSELSELVVRMANGATLTTPSKSSHIQDLAGLVLEANSSSSNTIDRGNYTASGDESFLITCSNGAYRFVAESQFFLSFDNGSSARTDDTVEHIGGFANHVNFAGGQVLSLVSQDQGTFAFTVTPSNGGVFLDETFYAVTGTSEQQCS